MTIDYKETLNLPQTDFPMKANLAEREPQTLKFWEDLNIYETLQTKRKGKPKFILNDGPPFANGAIHIGHAVNKILKDFILKAKRLSGFEVPYVPGWDCHGLPIEHNVEKEVGRPGLKVDAKTFRKKCRDYVLKQIDLQREAFIRLGVIGDWAHPYQTMDYHYEADTIRALAKIISNGHLHKGYRPVHWCMDCASALAEAEVEYREKTSPSIYVAFEVAKSSIADSNGPFSFVIWTTTPWTLPANEAVAVNAEFEYVLIEGELKGQSKRLMVAKDLEAAFVEAIGLRKVRNLSTFKGQDLEGIKLKHPFFDRQVPVVLGDHVTLETGTGCVHIAPAHGVEDFAVGLKYALPLENPVGSNGCYLSTTPIFAGEFVFKANDAIIALLKENGNLLKEDKITHSYPHCWRHKTPLIFRATQQWFISMDNAGLREHAIQAIHKVNWIPDWGQARIEGMIKDRPDWCISRQRTWGVPLALFVHKETGELHPDTPRLMEEVAKRVEKEGVDAWYDLDAGRLLGKDAEHYEKVLDIIDVWFDSGIAHYAVLEKRKALAFPADLYLEGSDQHRGWFHSSLLTSVAMQGCAPYKQVLTHGFVVDAQGRKMSKSLGNVIAPDKVIKTLGADILRLWVSATDYRAEMGVSDEILRRTTDIYRRIRNTARFLLANLSGFDPKIDLVPIEHLLELDKWILGRAFMLQQEIIQAYEDYQFHSVYQKVHQFCAIDLGSFYLDVIKDRQYTGKKEGKPRRSAQTALYYIAEMLVRWIAPILSFTAEEFWKYLPGEREKSVFFSEWYEGLKVAPQGKLDDAFWQEILVVREAVNKALEESRASGAIGSGLEAEVSLYCDKEKETLLKKLDDELRFALITSKAEVFPESERPSDAVATSIPGLMLKVVASTSPKCVRCWHRRADVNQNKDYPEICGRCVENIAGSGEGRHFA